MKYFLVFNIIIFLIFVLAYLIRIKQIDVTFMSRDYTITLKGFSILTVIWAHGGAYLGVGNLQFIAGTGVAIFLICSGYGLEISYQKYGLKRYWTNRIIRVYIPLLFSELVYEIATSQLSWTTYCKRGFLLGAGGWYIRYIVICYFIFYVCKVIKKSKKDQVILIFIIFTIFYVMECFIPENMEMPFIRARQMYSFPLGILCAQYFEKVRQLVDNKKYRIYGIVIGGELGVSFVLITQITYIKETKYWLGDILSIFTVLPLAIAIILLAYTVNRIFNNLFFYYTGIISYELYIIQGYMLMIIGDSFIRVVMFICGIYLLAIILYFITKMLKNIRLKPNK